MKGSFLLLIALAGCAPIESNPPAQQTSGSIQTIQDAYTARVQALRNQQEIGVLHYSLAAYRFDIHRLQERVDHLEEDLVEVKVTVRLMQGMANR